MATTNKIIIGIDNQVIELSGADKEAFLAQRKADNAELEKLKSQQEAQKQLKISAYTKLGLTQDEIDAIL